MPVRFSPSFAFCSAVAEFDANAFAKQGMQALKRDQNEDDLWLMGKRKDKKPKPKPAPAPANPDAPPKPKADRKMPALSVAKLQAFDKVGVKPPLRSSEVPATLEALKAKKVCHGCFMCNGVLDATSHLCYWVSPLLQCCTRTALLCKSSIRCNPE